MTPTTIILAILAAIIIAICICAAWRVVSAVDEWAETGQDDTYLPGVKNAGRKE